MRYLILSDLHANLEATTAVIETAATLAADRTLVLGDLVGYGPNPNEVVDLVRALPDALVIRGNHDRVAVGGAGEYAFNAHARDAIRWTRAQFSPDTLAWLEALPQGPVTVDEDVEICHGAPHDEDAYLFGVADAALAADSAHRRILLFGHTHVTALYAAAADGEVRAVNPAGSAPFDIPLGGAARWLINVGSVGQPRDGDWRAAFGLLDTTAGTCTCHRVAYDAATTRARMRAAGLPALLIARIGPASLG